MIDLKRGAIVAIAASMGLSMISAFAAEKDETPLDTTLGITANYSTEITPEEDDVFAITLSGSSTGDVSVELNASEYSDLTKSFKVEPDNYKITNIEYKGSNEAIVSEGFSMNNTFSVMEGEYADVTLAIGTDEGMLLNSIYESTISYQNGEIVNGKEAFMQQPSADQTDENVEPEAVESEAEDQQDTTPEVKEDTENEESAEIEESADKADEPSAIEKDAKVIYEDPEEYEENESAPLIMRAVPLLCAAAITALVVFILHKKGKI